MRLYLMGQFSSLGQHPVRWASLLLFTILAVWATSSGLRWQAETEHVLAETPADLLTDRESWLTDLRKVEQGEDVSPYAARPINLTILALHRPSGLASLAFRDEAMDPHSALINGWRNDASLFRRYEVQGAAALRAGKLDLAFVVTVLLPLFMLVLCFDVLSSEKESGRYPLFLVQGGNAVKLLLSRLLVVALPLIAIPIVCVLFAAAISEASLASVLIWCAALSTYCLFWAGTTAWIAARFDRPVAGALAVLAVWSTIVVLIPSGSQFAAQALHPLPSRVSLLSDARDAEATSRRNIEERAEIYMAEHPGQADTPDEAVPGFYQSAYLANIDINQRVAPMVSQLESSQAAQHKLVAALAYLSPAMLTKQALHAASGTGAKRSAEFRSQVRGHLRALLETIGPATVRKTRLSSEEAAAFPEFELAQTRTVTQWLPGIGWTFLLAIVLTCVAIRHAADRS